MNKYQESLNYFMYAEMPSSVTYEDIKNMDGEEVANYYMPLKELVDKATPMKVRIIEGKYHCPIINHRVYKGQKYCSYCGQKLDWSLNNE